MSCLEVTHDNGESELLYGRIEGLEFRWGETRLVTYTRYEVDDPLVDGSSARYELDSETLIDTADANVQFTLVVYDQGWFRPAGPSDRRLFVGDEIACAPELCSELDTRAGAFSVRFQFGAPAGAVATALAIE